MSIEQGVAVDYVPELSTDGDIIGLTGYEILCWFVAAVYQRIDDASIDAV